MVIAITPKSNRRKSHILDCKLLFAVVAVFLVWYSGVSKDLRSCTSPTQREGKKRSRTSLAPFERSPKPLNFTFLAEGEHYSSITDTITPFHRYMMEFGLPAKKHNFPELPFWHTWLHYFEAYHNHFARFRKQKKVVFMEVGVQSGGKIPLLRKYFGPGLVYVGLDINPSTKMFETTPDDDFTVHVEIGDAGDPFFLNRVAQKYPHVDIFLDDGGHTMKQQMTTMQYMLPHVQPEGIYICEDLATSWLSQFGGVKHGHVGGNDPEFIKDTTVGLVHQTLDWFMAPNINTEKVLVGDKLDDVPDDLFSRDSSLLHSWWKTIPAQVKHIHYYNQIVVYEKGVTYRPVGWRTAGFGIPYSDSGEHPNVNWGPIIKRLDSIFGESLL